MAKRILVLQEKQQNVLNLKLALYDCDITTVDTIGKATQSLEQGATFNMIVCAVHLENDGQSVFDFLKFTKTSPSFADIPFVFYCSESSTFARSVRDGLQIAARALGAQLYVTMEEFDGNSLRSQLMPYLSTRRVERTTSASAEVDISVEVPFR